MDELKLKLSTKLMKGIVANLIEKFVFKKLGYRPDIRFNEIELQTREDGKVLIHINVDAEMWQSDVIELIKKV